MPSRRFQGTFLGRQRLPCHSVSLAGSVSVKMGRIAVMNAVMIWATLMCGAILLLNCPSSVALTFPEISISASVMANVISR